MKKQFRSIGVVFGCIVLASVAANAQVSGVPGDGVPDLYYFQGDASPAVLTSFGLVDRPGGTMLLDTDGYDFVAGLIGGPNVSAPLGTGTTGCDLCNNQELPASAVDPEDPESPLINTYTVGFAGGSTQWIRTSPLAGRAFLGVIGSGYVNDQNQPTAGWPANPGGGVVYTSRAQGLARYATGLTQADFPTIFNDGTSEALWSVRVAADTGAPKFTNVTIIPVPEPAAGLFGVVGLAMASVIRRRVG